MRPIALLGLACSLLLPGHALPAEPPAAEGKADLQKKLAAVYDALGLAVDKGKRWVVVDCGPAGWKTRVEGWLVAEKPDSVTVFSADGEIVTLRQPRPGERQPEVAKDQKLSFEEFYSPKYRAAWSITPAEFAAHCERFLSKGDEAPEWEKNQPGAYRMQAERHRKQSRVLDLCRYGYWARQAGHDKLASSLETAAEQAREAYLSTFVGASSAELPEFVAETMATELRSNAVSSAHGGAPRAELLKTWETIAKIPYHKYRDDAERTARGYRDQIAEDKAWKEPDAKALAKMSAREQAAYWMYHLRDLDIGQMSDPGKCYVVVEEKYARLSSEKAGSDKWSNPAWELKKLGWDALPEVIAHLDDTRPTRCEGHWRRFAPESYVLLRYGDCCQQIFEAITGHGIYSRRTTNGYPVADGKEKDCKAEAEKWYQEFKKKGEKQILVEGVERGNRDSPVHAERLAAKFPADALGPITRGARASQNEGVRQSLVRTAGELKGDEAAAFLHEELRGPFLGSRVAAARALVQRGDSAGVRVAVEEWRKLNWADDRDLFPTSPGHELIELLGACGDASAVRALGDKFREKPIATRSTIVESLRQLQKDLRGRPLTAEVQAAVDGLLVNALGDPDEESSLRGGPAGKEVRDPTIGDLAAEALAERWNQPGLFDIYARWGERERMRLALQNTWRTKRGEKPLPIPARFSVKPASHATLRPLLEAVENADTPGRRRDALRALEEVGLPALPAVRKLSGSLKPDDAARKEIGALAERLAATVAQVRFSGDSLPPSDQVRKRVEGLRDKTLNPATLLEAFTAVCRELPPGARGIVLSVERPGDDSGAVLTATVIPEHPKVPVASTRIAVRRKVQLDDKKIEWDQHGYQGFGLEAVLSSGDWQGFRNSLAKVVPAKPEQYVFVQVSLELGR